MDVIYFIQWNINKKKDKEFDRKRLFFWAHQLTAIKLIKGL